MTGKAKNKKKATLPPWERVKLSGTMIVIIHGPEAMTTHSGCVGCSVDAFSKELQCPSLAK
jgi:hypothetical protein